MQHLPPVVFTGGSGLATGSRASSAVTDDPGVSLRFTVVSSNWRATLGGVMYQACVGIDWATTEHVVCALDGNGVTS